MTLGDGTVLALPIVLAVGYAALTTAERARRDWSRWRLASFVLGSVLVAWALSPSFDAYADRDFAGHMAQHLLLAMVAPVGLVLGAPVTLLLRSLPVRRARTLTRVLRSRLVHLLTNPWVALLLSTGGVVAFYFTPLYGASTRDEWLHAAIHLHFLASGCLFAWVVAGPDPAPSRPTVRLRLVVLGVAIAVHASAAQLLYAGLLVQVHEPVAQMQAAGDLMYFGGDVAELLLALALLSSWRPRRFRSAVIG